MKTKKIKWVDIVPPPVDSVCFNKRCRRVLRGRFKILEFPNGTKAHLCMKCFPVWLKTTNPVS